MLVIKSLGTSNGVATSITVDANTDAFYILAYDGGEAFLYFGDADGDIDNASLTAAEIVPVVHFTQLQLCL